MVTELALQESERKPQKVLIESQARRRRVVCLTNIPSPYRLHFFRILSDELEKCGGRLEVWFMAESELGRYWQFNPADFKFRYRVLGGTSCTLADSVIHFNPSILYWLRKQSPDVLLLAGSWIHPTNILAILVSKILNKSTLLFWSESHLKSIRQKGRWVDKLRALLLRSYDGFAVPGKLALDYVNHYAPNRPIYVLPNTVDETIFRNAVLRERAAKDKLRKELGIPNHKRVLLLVARLIPEKNIMPFLSALSSLPSSVARSFILLIAGDGPLKEQANSWINRKTSIDVRLLGHVAESELVKLYAVADSLILPSLSDPNPLSVVEALWAGLPLILSDRVGNHYETLREGENGWLFKGESIESTREVLEAWAASPDSKLEAFGRVSALLAETDFNPEAVVKNFVDQVFPPNSTNQ